MRLKLQVASTHRWLNVFTQSSLLYISIPTPLKVKAPMQTEKSLEAPPSDASEMCHVYAFPNTLIYKKPI